MEVRKFTNLNFLMNLCPGILCTIKDLIKDLIELQLSLIYNLFHFLTIKIPSKILDFLDIDITVQFNTKLLLFIFILFIIGVYILIRYRLLTNYSRLKEVEPDDIGGGNLYDLQPDILLDPLEEKPKTSFNQEYLPTFLKNIKIFGYLEDDVSKELSRYVNTRKLLKGDKIFHIPEREKSFYIVMDGCVQVYAKNSYSKYSEVSGGDYFSEVNPEIEEDLKITQVESGGTLSSLFTLLSLFTENLNIMKIVEQNEILKLALKNSMETNGAFDNHVVLYRPNSTPSIQQAFESVHPNIVARASVDTTLAVIPAEAFLRLTEKYPASASHIVQVILTRFQRVTFLTLYKYLGLTEELLEIEKKTTQMAKVNTNSGFDVGLVKKMTNVDSTKEGSDMDRVYSTSFKNGHDITSFNSIETPKKVQFENISEKESILHIHENYAKTEEEKRSIEMLKNDAYACIERAIGLENQDPFKNIVRAGDLNFGRSGYAMQTSISSDHDKDYAFSSKSKVGFDWANEIQLFFAKKGAILSKQGERILGVYLVLDGKLSVEIEEKPKTFSPSPVYRKASKSNHSKFPPTSIKNKKSISDHLSSNKNTFFIYPGGVAGYLSAITGAPSYVNITATNDSILAFLSRSALDKITELHPIVLLTLSKRLIYQLPPLKWIQAVPGQTLARIDQPADSIYIVLNGRLRTIGNTEKEEINLISEYGQGDSVAGAPRPYTLFAIRDSELVKIPKNLFDSLAFTHPKVTIKIARKIAEKSQQLNQSYQPGLEGYGKNNTNLKTIGIIPIHRHVPITAFANRLLNAFKEIGETALILDNTSIVNVLGKHEFTTMGRLKMLNFLAEQEEKVRLVLYVADNGPNSLWAQRCIRQADCILLVGLGDGDPSIGEFERLLVSIKTTARKELVLLHNQRFCKSGSTRTWLKNRMWVHAHHHVQFTSKTQLLSATLNSNYKKRNLLNIGEHIRDYIYKTTNEIQPGAYSGNRSDFCRLARRLCGKSIGLVLGGGGARGMGHLGVIQALEEAGIPIDVVGGTSIGAFVAGLYARDSDSVAILGRAKMFAGRMSSIWRLLSDLTYPMVSWFSGHEFNRGLWKCFNDIQIEDLWLPYYCVTTNITHSCMEVHRQGYLWRYIRASMSLSGFLPPMCDGKNMLLDGGYMDYLPVGVMKSMGVNTIFAVDVAGEDDFDNFINYGDSLSGWRALFFKYNPFFRKYSIPSLAEIQSRLAFVSSVKQLELAKNTAGCYYIRLPVKDFNTLDFHLFQTLKNIGYDTAKVFIKNWNVNGMLKEWTKWESGFTLKNEHSRPFKILRRNSM